MKLAVAALAALCLAGCGGYVMVQSRTEVPAERPRPVPHYRSPDIGPREAAHIAIEEASQRECSDLSVKGVECGSRHCDVDLRGYRHHRPSERIRVRVDRFTGGILSYKAKFRHEDEHHRHHDGDRDDDDDD